MNQHDQQPRKHNLMEIKKFTFFNLSLGILLYLADVISDICLAMKYYNNGHKTFFILTLFLVIISAIISSLLSFYMYWKDDKNEKFENAKTFWILRGAFLIFGIAPVLRNFHALYFAWKSYCSKNKAVKLQYAQRMDLEVIDSSYLRLYEAFFESGPQLVLQMYIFIKTQSSNRFRVFAETETQQCFTMLLSAISIASAILAYSRPFQSTFSRDKLKWFPTVVLFLYRFFEIISRILAMSLGISATPYFHAVFVVRYIITAILVYFIGHYWTKIWGVKSYHILLLSVIMMFIYFTPDAKPHRKRAFYYLAMALEITAIWLFWFFFTCPEIALLIFLVSVQVSSFCLSILFMVIFYIYHHCVIEKGVLENNSNGIPENLMQDTEDTAALEVVQDNPSSTMELKHYQQVS